MALVALSIQGNKKCDCNLLNNRFLKKKSITIGNDIEMSELLWSAVFFHRFKQLYYKDRNNNLIVLLNKIFLSL